MHRSLDVLHRCTLLLLLLLFFLFGVPATLEIDAVTVGEGGVKDGGSNVMIHIKSSGGNVRSTMFRALHLSPPSTTDLRLCGVRVEETDPALLPNVTRLHLATIPRLSWGKMFSLVSTMTQITHIEFVNLEFPIPTATPSLSFPCLRRLPIEFNKKSQLEFCGLILAPALVDLQIDSHMEGSIDYFADECTHMLRTVKQLDLGIHGFLREPDVAAVFAASPMVQEINLVRSRALEARVIFEETIQPRRMLPHLIYLRLPHFISQDDAQQFFCRRSTLPDMLIFCRNAITPTIFTRWTLVSGDVAAAVQIAGGGTTS
ncbi:hypothetical protein B0H17DRAFT_1150332 [Mycena rosella]|uniref:Secreted protein n=1 Tax=Mycena rosella TaxID=1033263 RepID=A0AAD7BSY6_MYCRO|nr:hypothetical protein B0H17DRAFT_1150332 [Mycena rosella]